MSETAVLFPGRFRDLATSAPTGRPTYPPLLAKRVADLVGLDKSRTVLDLGTGPGFPALDFQPFAARSSASTRSRRCCVSPGAMLSRQGRASSLSRAVQTISVRGLAACISSPSAALATGWIGDHPSKRDQTMTGIPILLDRASVTEAIADYILQVNFRGYRADRRKVLAVRQSDRTASLRNAGTPVRREVYYYIEGELFPAPDTTRLADGDTPAALAERLVAQIWDDLWVWNAYDFTTHSSGLLAEVRS
jgi:hypothetical protein